MGICSQDLDVILRLKEQGYLAGNTSIIEVGAQQLSNSFLTATAQLEKIGKLFDADFPHPFPASLPSNIVHGVLEHLDANAFPARDFWKWIGFTYASIDIDGSPGSIPLDLNYDHTPAKARGKYQLVTNFGTTEHVANQLNAFKIIHELTAIGGLMVHNLPSQGMLNHGLINYNPKFFWMLARSNGYKWLFLDYYSSAVSSYYELPQNIVDAIAPFNPSISERKKDYKVADSGLVVVLQKTFDSPYVSPLDVPTGTKTDNKILVKRYWSVFLANAFEKFQHGHLGATKKSSKSIGIQFLRFIKSYF